MKLLLAILLTLPFSALAQFGAGVAAGGWEPLNVVTKAGIVACYDAGNASTITLNGTGVQQLRSRVVGVTNHLNQATAVRQPPYDTTNTLNGRATLYFDGVTNAMQTAAFTWNQPEEVYWLCEQLTWTSVDHLFDGGTTDTMTVFQYIATPSLRLYAGSGVAENGNLLTNIYGVIKAVFNGASSSLTVNKTTPTTGNPGAANAGGFTLGSAANFDKAFNGRFAYGILCSKTNGTPEANFLRTCLMRRAGL